MKNKQTYSPGDPLPWQEPPNFKNYHDSFSNRVRALFGPDCKVKYDGPVRESTKQTLGPYFEEMKKGSR